MARITTAQRLIVSAALVAGSGTTNSGSGSLSTVLNVSRLTGPAPLAVMCNSVGTTAAVGVDPVRQVSYCYTFDDPSGGNFSLTGNARNLSHGGPVACHYFTDPGDYTIKVCALDISGGASDGENDQVNVDIEVFDANDWWPGTQTICLSRNTDHTGAPAGATLISNVTSWPTWADNTRYMLHKGQDFTSLGNMNLEVGDHGPRNFRIDTYGSGARPIVAEVNVNCPYGCDYTDWPQDVSIIGLNGRRFYNYQGSIRLMFYDCVCTNPIEVCFSLAAGFNDIGPATSGALWTNPREMFVINCSADSTTSSDGIFWIDGGAYIGVQNVTVDNTLQHNIRAGMMYKSILDNCYFPGHIRSDPERLCAKVHGNGIEENQDMDTWVTPFDPDQRSQHVWFRQCLLGSTDGNYRTTAGLAPQNGVIPEGLQDCGAEDCTFFRCPTSVFDWARTGHNMINRGNIRSGGAAINYYEIFEPVDPFFEGPYYDNEPSAPYMVPV